MPNALLSLIPFVNLWWLWRWSQGVEWVTDGAWSATGTYALSLLLPGIGAAVIQSAFNDNAKPIRGVSAAA